MATGTNAKHQTRKLGVFIVLELECPAPPLSVSGAETSEIRSRPQRYT